MEETGRIEAASKSGTVVLGSGDSLGTLIEYDLGERRCAACLARLDDERRRPAVAVRREVGLGGQPTPGASGA